jgi:hypothetical protein
MGSHVLWIAFSESAALPAPRTCPHKAIRISLQTHFEPQSGIANLFLPLTCPFVDTLGCCWFM